MYKCIKCGNKATQLCDMPDNGVIFYRNYEQFKNQARSCSLPVCDECATIIDGATFCPDCIKKIKDKIKRGAK